MISRLTASEVVRVLDDCLVEAGARQNVLPRATVSVQVELVVLFGHVYAVTVQSGDGKGPEGVWGAIPRPRKGTNADIRFVPWKGCPQSFLRVLALRFAF